MHHLVRLVAVFLVILSLSSPIHALNTYNVLDYGAVGDGVSDDTNSFNRCIESALSDATGTATVIVPSTIGGKQSLFLIANSVQVNGSCPVGNNFVLSIGGSLDLGTSRFLMVGSLASFIIALPPESSCNFTLIVQQLNFQIVAPQQNVIVFSTGHAPLSLVFDSITMSNSESRTSIGMFVGQAASLTLTNSHFLNFQVAVASQSANITINQNIFESCSNYALSIFQGRNSIANNTFISNETDFLVDINNSQPCLADECSWIMKNNRCINEQQTNDFYCDNGTFNQCYFENNTGCSGIPTAIMQY